ncbi:MAG TPA: ATP-binding protein [Candidatus Saccharibacteria bacterium]|nr:ATP-binding protein [Candidatus Saccharibacteria bacterium]
MNNEQAMIEYWLAIPEETTTVEFKRLDGPKIVTKVLETIVAMANTDGGTIVLGIDDPEKTAKTGLSRVYGIEENIELYDEIGRKLVTIQPGLVLQWPGTVVQTADGLKSIALVHVPRSTQYLYQVRGRAFTRLNKGNKELTAHESIQYAYLRGFSHADSELVSVDMKLLETETYQQWAKVRGVERRSVEDALLATGLARHNEQGIAQPTRAAVMLFAEFPSMLMDTRCAVRIFVYSGTIERYEQTPNLLQTPIVLDAPVIQLIRKSQETVLQLLRTGVRVPSGFVTTYAIPERAIKEAITNAVIHRDYYTKRDIEIRIFEDRVEVDSPGLFVYNITKENIGWVRAEGVRNDLLVKHLRAFPEPPNLDINEGVPAMRSAMRAERLYPPLFHVSRNSAIWVVLWNEKESSEWEKLRDYLQRSTYVKNEEARGITGIVQANDMSKRFAQWTKQGLLVRIPSDPNVRKNVKYKLANQPDHALSAENQEDNIDQQG